MTRKFLNFILGVDKNKDESEFKSTPSLFAIPPSRRRKDLGQPSGENNIMVFPRPRRYVIKNKEEK